MERSTDICHKTSFGSTSISGRATAQLGDRYNTYSDGVHIAHASIYVHNHGSCHGSGPSSSSKRLHNEAIYDEEPGHSYDLPCPKRRKHSTNGEDKKEGQPLDGVRSSSLERIRVEKLLNIDYGLRRSLIEQMSSMQTRNLGSKKAPDDDAVIDMTMEDVSNVSTTSSTLPLTSSSASRSNAAGMSSQKLLRSFALVTTFTLAACHRLLQNGCLDSLLRTLNGPISLTAARVIAFFMSRVPLNERILSEAREYITFEDVFQRRRPLSLSILEFPEIMHGFFKAHYSKSSAKPFIDRGQFNLIIDQGGMRRRLASMQEVCRSRHAYGRGTILRMAVLFRASIRICLVCYNDLQLRGLGTYTCWWCQREYYSRSKQIDRAYQLDTSVFVVPPWMTLKADASQIANGGILNVDIDTRWADYWATYCHKMSKVSLGNSYYHLLLNGIKTNCAILEPQEIYPGKGDGYTIDMCTPSAIKPTTYMPKLYVKNSFTNPRKPIWKLDSTFLVNHQRDGKWQPTAAAQLWHFPDKLAAPANPRRQPKRKPGDHYAEKRGAVTQPNEEPRQEYHPRTRNYWVGKTLITRHADGAHTQGCSQELPGINR